MMHYRRRVRNNGVHQCRRSDELIDKQFDCMAKYLSWDMLFQKSYYATARDELEKNKDSMNELEEIGKNL